MRDRAHPAAKQFDLAEREFRKGHRPSNRRYYFDNVALAHPGLARADAFSGDVTGSRDEYEKYSRSEKTPGPKFRYPSRPDQNTQS
jgi:hypothetical protein